MTITWNDELLTEGRDVIYRVGREGDDFVAEWPGLLLMRMKRDEREPRISTSAAADPELVDKVRKGFLAGLVFHLHGGLALHASSLEFARGAIALVGDSRSGKSTTAAALVDAAKTRLLADDATLIEWDDGKPILRATESTSWLREDAAVAFGLVPEGEKTARPDARRIGGGLGDGSSAIPEAGTRLSAVLVLRFDESAPVAGCLRKLAGVELMSAMLPSIIRWDTGDPTRAKGEIDALAKLARLTDIFEFARPRNLSNLGAQIEGIMASLSCVPLAGPRRP